MIDPLDSLGCVASAASGSLRLFSWQEPGLGIIEYAHLPLAAASWFQWHPVLPLLYVVSELDEGSVTTVRVERTNGGSVLTDLGTVGTSGSGPCHLAVTTDARHLVVANYGSGTVSSVGLALDGEAEDLVDTVQHIGSGPDANRQASPHPHQVVLGQDMVNVVDLGTDEVRSYALNSGRFEAVAVSRLPAGTGPRQLVRIPGSSTALVLGELSGRLLTLDERLPGSFAVIGDTPASGRTCPNSPAQLTFDPGNGLAYVSNRGPDTISVFDVSTGIAKLVAEQDTGAHPRHFTLTARHLLVAGQNDNSLNIHARTAAGDLDAPIRLETTSPSCILLAPNDFEGTSYRTEYPRAAHIC